MSLPLLPPGPRRAFFATGKALCQFVLTVFYRLRATGREHLPREGGYLVVANHQSLFDPPAIGVSVPGQFRPMARKTLRDVPIMGWAMANCHCIFVDQDGGQDRAAIQACIDRLKEGGVVAIFPEGARTFDGEIHTFAAGASLIARKAKVPVVPAAIDGAFDAWPRTKKFPRVLGQRIRVHFGEVIPAERIAEMKGGAVTALFEERVRELFAELTGRGSRGG